MGGRLRAKRVRRREKARGPLGPRHHLLELVEGSRQPDREKVRQQVNVVWLLGQYQRAMRTPRGVLRAEVPWRANEQPPVRVVRNTQTARKPCIAPRAGSNVLLAGVPRRVSKLHRPWPGGGLPVRASSSLFPKSAEITTAPAAAPSGDGVDASYGPSAVLRCVWTNHGEADASPHSPLSRPHPRRF